MLALREYKKTNVAIYAGIKRVRRIYLNRIEKVYLNWYPKERFVELVYNKGLNWKRPGPVWIGLCTSPEFQRKRKSKQKKS